MLSKNFTRRSVSSVEHEMQRCARGSRRPVTLRRVALVVQRLCGEWLSSSRDFAASGSRRPVSRRRDLPGNGIVEAEICAAA